MIDIAAALDTLVPAANYSGSLTANDQASYEALVWTDARPKPLWEDVFAAAQQMELATVLASKKRAIELLKQEKFNSGFTFDGNLYQIDEGSQRFISAVLQSLDRGDGWLQSCTDVANEHNFTVGNGGIWDANNVAREFTEAQFNDFAKAVGDHCSLIVLAAFSHKRAVELFETCAEIENYDITTGWPVTAGLDPTEKV